MLKQLFSKKTVKKYVEFANLLFFGVFAFVVFSSAVWAQCEKKKTRDLVNQGDQLFKQNNFAAALEYYDRASDNKPPCSFAFFKRGLTLRKLNRLNEAITAFERALTLNYADKTELYLALADSYYAKGDMSKDVLKNAQAAINLNPQAVEAWTLLAGTYQNLGQTENEIKALAEIVQLAPNDIQARRSKGVAHFRVSQYKEALDEFKKLAELESNNAATYLAISDLHRILGENQLAVEVAQNALKIKPDHAQAHFTLGNSYLALKQYDNAAGAYQQAINHKTEYAAESYYNLGLTKMALAKDEAATSDFQKALEQQVKVFAPDIFKIFVYKSLGSAYGQLGKYDEAVKYLDEVKKLNSDDASTNVDLSWWYTLLGKKEEALQAASRAIVKAPTDPMGYVNRCRAYLIPEKLNEPLTPEKLKGASWDCEKAFRLNASDGEALFYYGLVWRGKNRPLDADIANKKAITALEKELSGGKNEDRELIATAHKGRRNILLNENPVATITVEENLFSIRLASPYTPYILGNAYSYDDKQINKAVNYYQLALRRAPRFSLALLNLGIVYVKLKDMPAAQDQYFKLVKFDPKTAEKLKNIIEPGKLKIEPKKTKISKKKIGN